MNDWVIAIAVTIVLIVLGTITEKYEVDRTTVLIFGYVFGAILATALTTTGVAK